MTDWRADYDREDYRQSLYTNTKDDHPALWATGEPCDCAAGDDRWERDGVAMAARWPRALDAEQEREAG